MDRLQMKKRLEDFLGQPVDVPESPALPEVLATQLDALGFELVYLPTLEFMQPHCHWRILPEKRYRETEIVERSSLPGRWLAIERRAMPECGREMALDSVVDALRIASRFGHSWDHLHNMVLCRLADLLEVPRSRVRLPWLIERNFCGNLFAHLSMHETEFQNWHCTPVWEWCENRYGRYHALLTGRFGLASVGWCFSGDEWYGIFAWRSVIEVEQPF
jgi:hypothetical protein